MTEQETAIVAAISLAARRGEVCPSLEALRRVGKIGSRSATCALLAKLNAEGILETIKGGGSFRVIRIIATGEHTKAEEAPLHNTPRRLDEFAEHLANGLSVIDTCWRMAITENHGRKILGIICKRLGPQAV